MRRVLYCTFLLLWGCASPVVDYQSGTDFTAYTSAMFDTQKDDTTKSLDAARVETALKKSLPVHGLQITPSRANLQLHYRLIEYSHFDGNEVFWGVGASRGNVGLGFSTPVSARESRKLRLEIEFVDTATQQVVWKGRSAVYLDEDAASSAREKWIDRQVEKMLEGYPPGV